MDMKRSSPLKVCSIENKTEEINTIKDEKNNFKLKVWWIPQIPMKPFEILVKDIYIAKFLLDTLAQYDLFQFNNKIKPDYCNIGGLMILEENEWFDWSDEDGGYNLDEYFEQYPEEREKIPGSILKI